MLKWFRAIISVILLSRLNDIFISLGKLVHLILIEYLLWLPFLFDDLKLLFLLLNWLFSLHPLQRVINNSYLVLVVDLDLSILNKIIHLLPEDLGISKLCLQESLLTLPLFDEAKFALNLFLELSLSNFLLVDLHLCSTPFGCLFHQVLRRTFHN